MSMPALQAMRRAQPQAELTLLVKPGLLPLWAMHGAPDRVLGFRSSPAGTIAAAVQLRRMGFDRCYILPNSFRSALIPWLAGVPERIGPSGHRRERLLTRAVDFAPRPGREHQAYEYLDLLLPDAGRALEWPRLEPPAEAGWQADDWLRAAPRPRVVLIPGAARGPSKRWPLEHFAALGRRLVKEKRCGLIIVGGRAEVAAGTRLARAIGADHALNLVGQTSLAHLAALLTRSDLVICNDSGGMHLAAAVGARVLALFGLTQPAQTGPLGPRCRIMQEGPPQSRDIARRSAEAEKALAALAPERVYAAARECLVGGL